MNLSKLGVAKVQFTIGGSDLFSLFSFDLKIAHINTWNY